MADNTVDTAAKLQLNITKLNTALKELEVLQKKGAKSALLYAAANERLISELEKAERLKSSMGWVQNFEKKTEAMGKVANNALAAVRTAAGATAVPLQAMNVFNAELVNSVSNVERLRTEMEKLAQTGLKVKANMVTQPNSIGIAQNAKLEAAQGNAGGQESRTAAASQPAGQEAAQSSGTIGEPLSPIATEKAGMMASITEGVGKFAAKLSPLAETVVNITQQVYGFVMVASEIAGAAENFNNFQENLKGLQKQFGKISEFMRKSELVTSLVTKAQWLFNASLLGCPIIWIIVGIMAVVAAGVLLYRNWDTITKFFGEAWGKATQLFAVGYQAVVNFLKDFPNKVAYGVGYAIGYAITWLSALPANMLTFLIEFYNSMSAWISLAIANVITFFVMLPGAVFAALSEFLAAVDAWANNVYTAVVAWFTQIPTAISEAFNNAYKFVTDLWEKIKNFGGGLVLSFAAGAKTGADDASKIPGRADGGIFDIPHLAWFAEGGVPEAAIPIDGSSRALSLWAKTGELLGVTPGVGAAVSATFAPTINMAGGASAVDVRQVLENEREKFRRMLEDVMAEERRVSYA